MQNMKFDPSIILDHDPYVYEQMLEIINDHISEKTGYCVDALFMVVDIDYELDTSDDGNEID